MSFTNSGLITYKRITSNKTPNRNHAIDTITIHCYVGQVTAKQGCDYFATTDREVSANYVVGYDGSIGLSVDEKDRAWTSSSYANDHRAVTIEVACDAYAPYKVTDKAYNALINLVADICKRNKIKELKWKGDKSLVGNVGEQNMTVHRWFASTACPGDYLYKKHSDIAKKVNKKLKKEPSFEEYKIQVIAKSLNIRKTPKFTKKDIVGVITDKGVYTIVAEKKVSGIPMGKLKSGKGWVSLRSKYVKKL